MGAITTYGAADTNATKITSITAHNSSGGITVYKSITSDSGSAITVGEGLDTTNGETVAI